VAGRPRRRADRWLLQHDLGAAADGAADGDLVLRALRESGGWATSVPDEATYAAQADLAAREGLFAEPAAAITLAALRAGLAAGRLRGGERVVCLLTGVGFKDSQALQQLAEGRQVRPITAADILGIA
jgi:threonine synthase